jgi:hypothetical protein
MQATHPEGLVIRRFSWRYQFRELDELLQDDIEWVDGDAQGGQRRRDGWEIGGFDGGEELGTRDDSELTRPLRPRHPPDTVSRL